MSWWEVYKVPSLEQVGDEVEEPRFGRIIGGTTKGQGSVRSRLFFTNSKVSLQSPGPEVPRRSDPLSEGSWISYLLF